MKRKRKNKVVCWWSGGVTSAVACKLAINLFGVDNCLVIMIDTHNEHDDTYRFKSDCEKWYGKTIETISAIPTHYANIQEVWFKYLSLNVASGAICSAELKREVRIRWQKENTYTHQVFGYEFTKNEFNRAVSMKMNYPKAKAIFPLLMYGYDKAKCINFLISNKVNPPLTYKEGFVNNNCYKTGCIQGGVGYWQKIQKEYPEKFNNMAEIEHQLTNLKKQPVTMLKDQSNAAIQARGTSPYKWVNRVFLKKHPDYPKLRCLSDMKPEKVAPLFDCNGFCGTNDLLSRTKTEKQINFMF